MSHLLSTDLDDPDAYPYFLWDDPMTNAELRHRLATASPPERTPLLGKILREANDQESWHYITPQQFAAPWGELSPPLGRSRAFWRLLLHEWSRHGVIPG